MTKSIKFALTLASLLISMTLAACGSSSASLSESISDNTSLVSSSETSLESSTSSSSSSETSSVSSEASSESSSVSSSESSSSSSEDIYAPIISERIKNVILFIGDGMGFSHVEAASHYQGAPLAMASASIKTDMTTSSLSSGYTDSSASATAMATGTKVYNGSVGMTSGGQVLPNFIDQLGQEGVRSGFITSDTLYGGTPAGFLSHAVNRTNYGTVMTNMADSAADLIIGIAPNDFTTLYQPTFVSKGYTSINKMSGLSTNPDRIVSALPTIPAVGTGSSLDELTVFGLDYLDNNDSGFFLAVEGSAIDTKSHAGASEGMILELLAMDQAVDVALKWASNRTDTVIIVTADHETGGLTVGEGATSENILSKMNWTTTTHTTNNVPFYVWGLQEEDFPIVNGTVDNTDIYDIAMGLLSQS